jgi:hypothetical protein
MTSRTIEVEASSLLASGEDEAMCYLCHETEADDDGQQLRRDCACRGTDAGFFHLSCLTGYAATKSVQASDMNEFIQPWTVCPGCHQYYKNELAIEIATKFVSFVRRQYPSDTQRQVEALGLKLNALDYMLVRLQPVQKREAGVTANVLLSLIDRMKNDAPLTYRYSQMKAFAYNTHGRIALYEGTEESARRAVAHFENQLEVNEAIGFADGVVNAKRNIAFSKSKYEGDRNNEELLKASQELYKLRIAKHGEESELTIDAGVQCAIILQVANRGEEARELLIKLLATSKQVFGSDHNITKSVESML